MGVAHQSLEKRPVGSRLPAAGWRHRAFFWFLPFLRADARQSLEKRPVGFAFLPLVSGTGPFSFQFSAVRVCLRADVSH